MEVLKNPIRNARRRIQKDPAVAALIEKAQSVKISSKLSDELKLYYVTSRDVATGKFSHRGVSARFDNPMKSLEKIAAVILDIQAYRGRVIAIQCLLLEHANTLTSCKRVSIEHIRESYSEILKARGSLALQDIFIESVIELIIEKREYLDLFLKKIEIILKNLDSAYYAYREIGQIGMALITRVEGGRFSNAKI